LFTKYRSRIPLSFREWSLLSLGTLLLFGAVLLPSGMFRPPSQRTFLGPLTYDSRALPIPVSIPKLIIENGLASDLRIELRFQVFQRPEKYAYLISSPIGSESSFAVSIDNYGNSFIEIPIQGLDQPRGIVRLADSVPFGEFQKMTFDYSGEFRTLSLTFNDVPIEPITVNDVGLIIADQILLSSQELELGGSQSHSFNGRADLTLSYGSLREAFDLRNLRLFLALLGIAAFLRVLHDFKFRSRKSLQLRDNTQGSD